MRFLYLLLFSPALLLAQTDPSYEAYKAWDQEHRASEYNSRMQSLFEVSAGWVVKWPDSKFAWQQRRNSLLSTQNHSAELWKQAGENLIRLNPPHTIASSVAYDWVAFHINLKEAEALIASEIAWHDSRQMPAKPSEPSLADLIDEANVNSGVFPSLCTLAWDQIQLKEFDAARATLARIRKWLDGDFRHYFDQDPLETFPDDEAKYFIYSAQLAQAEEKNADALAFYQRVVGNPYFRREYNRYVNETRALWKQMGGSDEGWVLFSAVPELPAGVPKGHRGVSFPPWIVLDFKLPELNAPGSDSRTWTLKDFEGKSTIVYLWASWCGPCWFHLPAIQSLYNAVKDRKDIQIVTLSVDEDRETLTAFMKDKGYTFPVIVSKAYADKLLPQTILGQHWIVDRTGSIRLVRVSSNFNGAAQAFVDESIYKLTQVSKDARSPAP
jgi:peroxiredoxin